MATQIKAQSKITIDDMGNVAVREVTRFLDDDGNILAESKPHTKTYQPGDDISQLNGIGKEICQSVHTPERVAVMKAIKDAEKARLQQQVQDRIDAIKAGQGTKKSATQPIA